mmetsp:Transcript_42558/g.70231  ORF Transcript_42558/g.70231 Transcript_42558/m.70231 type:complete len:238 (+) Transcript_42558:139-852(+)
MNSLFSPNSRSNSSILTDCLVRRCFNATISALYCSISLNAGFATVLGVTGSSDDSVSVNATISCLIFSYFCTTSAGISFRCSLTTIADVCGFAACVTESTFGGRDLVTSLDVVLSCLDLEAASLSDGGGDTFLGFGFGLGGGSAGVVIESRSGVGFGLGFDFGLGFTTTASFLRALSLFEGFGSLCTVDVDVLSLSRVKRSKYAKRCCAKSITSSVHPIQYATPPPSNENANKIRSA